MTDVERLLTAELDDLGDRAPHDPDLAGSVRRRARRQVAVLASALAVLVLVAGGAVARHPAAAVGGARPRPPRPRRRPPSGARHRSRARCRTGPGPASAPPNPGIPMVYSDRGLMLAILFGTPLTAPPAADHNNKILWVAKVGAEGAFSIDARLEGIRPPVPARDRPGAGTVHSGPARGRVLAPRAALGQLHDTISLRYAPG